MFSKKYRIPRQALEKIIVQKQSVASDFFVVKSSNNLLPHPRFAIVVSKKVAKSSVARHLLKRRTAAAIRNYYQKLPNKDFVFFLKKEATTQGFKEIGAAVERFISKNSL